MWLVLVIWETNKCLISISVLVVPRELFPRNWPSSRPHPTIWMGGKARAVQAACQSYCGTANMPRDGRRSSNISIASSGQQGSQRLWCKYLKCIKGYQQQNVPWIRLETCPGSRLEQGTSQDAKIKLRDSLSRKVSLRSLTEAIHTLRLSLTVAAQHLRSGPRQ